MTFERILVAVDDSPAALDASRTAVDLARVHGARVRALTIPPDGRARAADAGRSLLAWVTDLAERDGVPADGVIGEGEPFRRILAEADTWHADLVVMGLSDRRGATSAYLGSETEQVLEFADTPVLVVPHRHRTDDEGQEDRA